MKIVQAKLRKDGNWAYQTERAMLRNPLVFVFGDRFLLEKEDIIERVRNEFPYKNLVFGSTAGEILGTTVSEDGIVVTAVEFEKNGYIVKRANILDYNKDARAVGRYLVESLEQENLRHVFVLSEGSYVNGSNLIDGMESKINGDAKITGGMCGDGSRFTRTLAGYDASPKEGEVLIIGFYGDTLEFSFSSFGGWIPFGPERIVTQSDGNQLFAIDDEPALNIYTRYLGDKADELPEASLFYPLNVVKEGHGEPVVRTILGIDGEKNSMTLAGDIPEGSRVQLMMASVDGIAMGARQAAQRAMYGRTRKPQLALLVSCIGRKLVMDQRVEEEIEEVCDVVGSGVPIFGFYSYGEMAPVNETEGCQLHNQTMTLTLISE